ncbi:MAG: NosD domain-containing protein [Promethearchaeota archaeon]|jgi:parallel beta-helix repeat protein
MKSHLKIKILFLVSLGVVVSGSVFAFNELDFNIENNQREIDNSVLKTSAVTGRIHINNNWSDTKIAGLCTGEGTISEPYIIKDLTIDGDGLGSCILIENSSEHFIIENCTISNGGSDYYDATIELYWVNNGNITNNQASNINAFGIILIGSNDNIITNNFITGKNGIFLQFSNSNLIYFNNFVDTRIGIETHNCIDNKWDSPRKLRYIFNSSAFTSYLGNYWSSLSGVDNNNDGIMDSPHTLDLHLPPSQWVYIDYYPLSYPITNYEILGEVTERGIIGYNIFFLIGLICIISIIMSNKKKKLVNK